MSTPSSATSSRSSSPELQSQSMQIFVKVLSGDTIPITVPEDTTISNLAHLLSLRTSSPSSTLRLVHAGRHLPPSSTLTSNNITRDSTIHVAGTLRGGMPPKKIKCNYKDCGVAAQRIVGHCGFCEGEFCGKHRMLEDHKCVKLEDCKKECHERNAAQLNAERTQVIKGI
ncbi:9a495b6f-52e3-4329-862d-192c6f436c79 [Sclerotinia trifoliorum]|uniref:9a495b6f-52e3-4329-862d-192c6f436c79 n=1 Tax=Sclerotinia trifoliorum TaxID=28548 RepID=A0A8H2VMP3_9HELO|nr:9a495b6f-52e3-4329-862d-192c6f436c79 [Sclerotinia trifoliorum]